MGPTCIVAAVYFALPACRSAQESAVQEAVVAGKPPFFADSTVVRLTIEAPFKQVFTDAHVGPNAPVGTQPEKATFAAKVSYEYPAGNPVSVEAKAKLRGQRSLQACAFPKLKFKVKLDGKSNNYLAGANDLRIGTHCSDTDKVDNVGKLTHEKAAYREAFAHHLLDLLAVSGQWARPALIRYLDSGAGTTLERQAFVFEDLDLVAARLKATKIEADETEAFPIEQADKLDGVQVAKIRLHAALIGNWDTSISIYESIGTKYFNMRNVDLLSLPSGVGLPIPHDFDMAAMVSGKVAKSDPLGGTTFLEPTPELLRTEATKRLKGDLSNPALTKPADLNAALASIRDKKDELLAALAAYPMDPQGRAVAKAHIEAFYEVLPVIFAQISR